MHIKDNVPCKRIVRWRENGGAACNQRLQLPMGAACCARCSLGIPHSFEAQLLQHCAAGLLVTRA